MIEKQKIIRSVSSMALCSGITAVLSIVQLSIVARFLTPEDYGIFAIPSIIVGAGGAFLAGVPLAMIQRNDFTAVQAASMQKWLYLIAAGFMLILPIVGFGVDRLSEFQGVFALTVVMAATLLITATGLLHQVWLRRELRMEIIAMANVVGAFVSVLTAIFLAWQGFGCWALVWATVVRVLVVMIMTRLSSDLELAERSTFVDARPLLGFGLSRGTDQVLSQFTSKLDQIVIGSVMGASTLGMYTVASNVARRPSDLLSPVLGSVLFPLYARMKESHEINEAYDVSHRFLSVIMLSVASLVSLFAEEIVHVLLGQKWMEAAPILAIVAFLFAFQMMEVPSKQVANAAGFSNRLLLWNLFSSVFLALVLFTTASLYPDLLILALILVVGRVVLYLLSFYVLTRRVVGGVWSLTCKVLALSIFPACLLITLIQAFEFTFGGKLILGLCFLILLSLLNLKLILKLYSNILFKSD
jgi:O-antigen/teichoic acid export membrane protein